MYPSPSPVKAVLNAQGFAGEWLPPADFAAERRRTAVTGSGVRPTSGPTIKEAVTTT